MNLCITKSLVLRVRTIFFTPVIVKSTEKNLDMMNKFCQSLGPLLYWGCSVRGLISHSFLQLFWDFDYSCTGYLIEGGHLIGLLLYVNQT